VYSLQQPQRNFNIRHNKVEDDIMFKCEWPDENDVCQGASQYNIVPRRVKKFQVKTIQTFCC